MSKIKIKRNSFDIRQESSLDTPLQAKDFLHSFSTGPIFNSILYDLIINNNIFQIIKGF